MDSRVSVVVATRDRRTELLATLSRHEAPVIVVDNASGDGTPDAVRAAYPQAEVVELASNAGAAARNVGAHRARTPYVAFADDDSYWEPGSLARAVRLLDTHPRAGLLAARVLVGADGRLDPVSAGMAQAPLGRQPDLPGPAVLGFLGCSAVVRRAAFLQVGGFSELLHIYGEETLLALDLAAAGWGLAYVEALTVRHHPSTRRGPAAARRAREARNRLLTAWLRRPAGVAIRATVHAAGRAVTDPAERRGLAHATAALPQALRLRRRLPAPVEQAVRILEAHAQRSLPGRRRAAGPGAAPGAGRDPGRSAPPGQSSSGSCTCIAASSAEAAPPSTPTSRATASGSSSGPAPSFGSTSRPACGSAGSSDASSSSGSSSASRASSDRWSSGATPGRSTGRGRSGGAHPESSGSSFSGPASVSALSSWTASPRSYCWA
jgi:GT2 family glycosyltransferase